MYPTQLNLAVERDAPQGGLPPRSEPLTFNVMPIIIWIGKSLLILGIFHFGVPTVVNATTRNSWAKLPVMLFCAFVAGAFMAWLCYVPYLLFFAWLALTYYTLQVMAESKFESEVGMRMS